MKSMSILGAFLSLGFMSAAAQAFTEIRVPCDQPNTACGMVNTTTATNNAIAYANTANLGVGDQVTMFAYGIVGGGHSEKTRYFLVLSTPVTSAANLYDSGYRIDVFDNAAPYPPLLQASAGVGDPWFYYFAAGFYVSNCGTIPGGGCP